MSILYEVLPVAGLIWAAAFGYFAVEQALALPHVRPVYQLFFVFIVGAYFVWQWLRGGQTLAMRAWRLRIIRADGRPLDFTRALLRYLYALTGTMLVGVTFIWAFVDRERAFLHDRLAGTRIVKI